MASKESFEKLLSLFLEFRWQITLLLLGILFLAGGIFISKDYFVHSSKVEVVEQEEPSQKKIMVEVSGAVSSPGVYEFSEEARIIDALEKAGGVTEDAYVEWVEKNINRAAKLTDGQKIYIPEVGEQSESASARNTGGYFEESSVLGEGSQNLININTASQSELESLWGIGPVYAQNIIEQRPYSSVEELLEKGVIKQNVYDRNRDLLTVY